MNSALHTDQFVCGLYYLTSHTLNFLVHFQSHMTPLLQQNIFYFLILLYESTCRYQTMRLATAPAPNEAGLCPCAETWVLVVHNSFKGVPNYERQGNEADVRNLQKVFSQDRRCRYAELANCASAEIVQTLGQWEKLLDLFTQLDEERNLRPSIFCLFILSHGKSGGIILTDHLVYSSLARDSNFDSYSTSDVWEALASISELQNCPKILFLAVYLI
jgi:hypothetical protein